MKGQIMATTTYVISNAAGEQVGTKSKKATAVALAEATGPGATVATTAGTVVHAIPTKKTINMSKPYTRVVGVDQDTVEAIDGKRVAYKRVRRGFALLDANWDPTDAGNGTYSAWDLQRHEYVEDLEPMTTREFGRWCADEGDAYRASHPALVNA